MPRYIDIEPFENQTGITSCCVQTFTQSENTVTVRNVKTSDIPTIDPESLRPHGRWVQYDGDSWKCSECGEENCWAYTAIKTVPGVVVQTDRYCPNCGTKMDEEEDDGYRYVQY